ncbi:hypothetical protein V1Y59_23565 [Gordonia sp. PKS22-38]|uniref:Adenylate kinase n=1 Tax=Gordonia prachuapensis TaxID=3115651 RepID=A0ABU7N221_9ACTN|nr:hypothetical protein [Gordonia sp. PKS22-38]
MNIVILGAPGAGKTTAATHLSTALSMAYLSGDLERDSLARPFGFSSTRAENIYARGGALAYGRYVAQFDELMIWGWLSQHSNSVIDTAGGYLITAAHRVDMLLQSSALLVLIHPHLSDLDDWLHRMRADRGESVDDWWRRGGRQWQLTTVRAADELAKDSRIIVVTEAYGDGLLSEVIARRETD